MKKFFKVILVVGLVVAVLLVGAVAALRILYPPAKLKALVIAKVEAQLGRQVALDGISLGIFSGVKMTGFKLSESPDFDKGTFVEMKSLILKPDLFSLLKKKFVIQTLELQGPRLVIVKSAQGFNFEDLVNKSSSTAQAPSSSPASPVALLVGRLIISDGTVSYQDKTGASTELVAEKISLDARALSLSRPFSAKLSFSWKGKVQGRPLEGSTDFDGRLELADLLLNKATLDIKEWNVQAWGTGMTLNGRIENLQDPQLDLKAKLLELDLAKIKPLIKLPPDLRLEGTPAASFEVKGSTKDLAMNLQLDLTAMTLKFKDVLQKSANVPLKLNFIGNLRQFSDVKMAPLELTVGEAKFKMEGTAKEVASDNTMVDLKVSSPPFDLKELGKISPAAALSGASGLVQIEGITLKGPLDTVDIRGRTILQGLGYRYDGYELAEGKGTLDFTPENLNIPQFSGILNNEPFQFKVSVRNYNTQPDIEVDGTWKTMDLGKWAQAAAAPAPPAAPPVPVAPPKKPVQALKTRGKIAVGKILHPNFTSSDVNFRWNLVGITPSLEKLTGTAGMSFGAGNIKDLDKLMKESKTMKALLAPLFALQKAQKSKLFQSTGLSKVIDLPSFSDIQYQKITGDYTFENGNALVKVFHLEGPILDINTQGTAHLVTEALNLNATIKISSSTMRGSVGSILTDESGVPTVKMKITGTLSDPKVKPELQQIAPKAVSEVLKGIQDKGILKEGEKIFKNIFK